MEVTFIPLILIDIPSSSFSNKNLSTWALILCHRTIFPSSLSSRRKKNSTILLKCVTKKKSVLHANKAYRIPDPCWAHQIHQEDEKIWWLKKEGRKGRGGGGSSSSNKILRRAFAWHESRSQKPTYSNPSLLLTA